MMRLEFMDLEWIFFECSSRSQILVYWGACGAKIVWGACGARIIWSAFGAKYFDMRYPFKVWGAQYSHCFSASLVCHVRAKGVPAHGF